VPGVRSLGVSDVTPQSVFGQQLNFKVTAGGVTIDGVIPDPMELPEKDISSVDAIEFVQDTLKKRLRVVFRKRV
jgi:hypothetical protein